jgi:hypothetical protein
MGFIAVSAVFGLFLYTTTTFTGCHCTLSPPAPLAPRGIVSKSLVSVKIKISHQLS